MAFFKHGLKRKQVRNSSQSSLDSASNIPNTSGLTFIDNSQGASAAISELSGVLDDAIEQADLQGNLRDALKKHLESLDEEASKYANSSIPLDTHLPPWDPTIDDIELVSLAWKCAANIYETERQTYLAYQATVLEEIQFIRPSTGGSTKAASITRVRPKDGITPLLSIFVIAVRGTEKLVAHMVNLNGQPKPFYIRKPGGNDSPSPATTTRQRHREADSAFEQLEAHAGFLNGAEALLPRINAELDQICLASPNAHVILTGHSAGGAIASLLYVKLLSEAKQPWPNFTFSCITFGSPPVVRPRPLIVDTSSSTGLCLSIINEYDLVTRSDTSYIRSIAQLFRSIYHLPPLAEEPDTTHQTTSTSSTPSTTITTHENTPGESSNEIRFSDNEWTLPPPEYHHVGALILLCKKLEDDRVTLRSLSIHPRDLARMLFCRIEVHRRKEYDARIGLLLAGRFNGRGGWE